MSNYPPPPEQPPGGQPPYGGGGQQPPYGGGGQPPYGGQPPGGQPYGAGGYGGGQEQKTSVMAIISLVTGILAIPCCGCIVFSLAAIVLGYLGRKEIAESGGAKKGDGLAKAGLILGIVTLVLAVIYWILVGTGTFESNYYTDY
jgi:hypothetical protein